MNSVVRRISRIEKKGIIRRVRTPEGARYFGQPIGSIIVRDPPGMRTLRRALRIDPSLLSDGESSVDKRVKNVGKIQRALKKRSAEWSDWEEGVNKEEFSGYAISDGAMTTTLEGKGGRAVIVWNPKTHEWSREHYMVRAYDEARGRWSDMNILEVFPDNEGSIEDWVYDTAEKELERLISDRAPLAMDHQPGFWTEWDGMRGRDWVFEDDEIEWSDDPEEQYAILSDEMDRLGIDILGQNERYASQTATAGIVSLMNFHSEKFPGFEKLQPRFSIDLDAATHIGAIAYNRQYTRHMKQVQRRGWADIYGRQGRDIIARAAEFDHYNPEDDYATSFIGLNPEYYADDVSAETLEYKWKNAVNGKNGSWFSVNIEAMRKMSPGMTYAEAGQIATVAHEIGHTFGYLVVREMWDQPGPVSHRPNGLREGAMDKVWDVFEKHGMLLRRGDLDPRDKLRNNINTPLLRKHLSEYGTTNMHEVFAETWASYILDPTPTKFVVDMGRLMEETMYEYLEHMDANDGWRKAGEER